MRTIDIFVIAFILVVGLILVDEGGGKGWQKKLFGEKAKTEKQKKFESTYENGLPSEYVPQGLEHFGSKAKLMDDLYYRRRRFDYAASDEWAELKKMQLNEGERETAYQALKEKQEAARKEMEQKHARLLEEYRKMDQESVDKGLR